MHVAASAVVGTLRTDGEGFADGLVLVGAAGAGADDVLADVTAAGADDVLAEDAADAVVAGSADVVGGADVVVLVLVLT